MIASSNIRANGDGSSAAAGQPSLFDEVGAPIEVSIVIPVYNENECVVPLYEEIVSAAPEIGRSFEILFVDDGSSDGTFETIKTLVRRDSRVHAVRLRRNSGQSAALQHGFDNARGAIIVTMDGDLQNDPRDISRLLAEIDGGYDIVSGWRKHRQDDFISRKIPSWIANRIIAVLTRVKIHDQGCSLKAYRREVTERVALYADLHRFLIVLMTLSGGRYKELVVNHRPRTLGRSKYGIARTWKVLLDLITVVMITRFTTRPGQWFGLLSLPFLALTCCAAAAAMFQYFDGALDGTPIVPAGVTLLFAFGFVHLILMACIGELIVRVGDYREASGVLLGTIAQGSDVD